MGVEILSDVPHEQRHRLNNLFARIVACAEGAIDAADEPNRVRALMEELIGCIERRHDSPRSPAEPSHG